MIGPRMLCTSLHTHTHSDTRAYIYARVCLYSARVPFIRRKTLWCISFDAVCALVMQIPPPTGSALAALDFQRYLHAFSAVREGWKFRIAKGALILICTSATAGRITPPPCITHGSRMEIDYITDEDGQSGCEGREVRKRQGTTSTRYLLVSPSLTVSFSLTRSHYFALSTVRRFSTLRPSMSEIEMFKPLPVLLVMLWCCRVEILRESLSLFNSLLVRFCSRKSRDVRFVKLKREKYFLIERCWCKYIELLENRRSWHRDWPERKKTKPVTRRHSCDDVIERADIIIVNRDCEGESFSVSINRDLLDYALHAGPIQFHSSHPPLPT